MDWHLNIESFEVKVESSESDNLKVTRDPMTSELILAFPGPRDATRITVDEHSLTFTIRRVELRLSEEVARQLADSLPPELIH